MTKWSLENYKKHGQIKREMDTKMQILKEKIKAKSDLKGILERYLGFSCDKYRKYKFEKYIFIKTCDLSSIYIMMLLKIILAYKKYAISL